MPKRARCTYCDRLFDRDRLDNHIVKCRPKHSTRKAQHVITGRKNLILDGNNIAYYLSHDGKARAENIANAYKSLVAGGYRPTTIVSAALRHKINKPNILIEMILDGYAIEAPRRTDDDFTIIETAQKRNADIVSNDRFLNWIKRFPWLPDRLRRYRMTPAGLILI